MKKSVIKENRSQTVEMPFDLPQPAEGWAFSTMGDIGDVVGGGTPRTSDEANFADQGHPWITPADLSEFNGIYIEGGRRCLTDQGLQGCSAKVMPKGTVLMSSRAPIGYLAIAANRICTNQGFKSFVCHTDIVPEYVFFWLRFMKPHLENMGSGSTFLEISGSRAREIPILIAPVGEQKRIAAKVEELLARVNTARERLAKVPDILKRFRQSVLTAACFGKLTADWRIKRDTAVPVEDILTELQRIRFDRASTPTQKEKIREIYSYQEKGDRELIPETWRYIALDKLCDSFQYGTSKKSRAFGKVPVLRMGNIQNGRIDWNELLYTSDDTEIAKYILQPGTVLFNRTNSPELVGKTGVYRGEQPAIFAGYLIRINTFENLDPEYLNLCLNTNYAREFCLRTKTDGVSQSNINAQKLGKFEVPFCRKEEQQEVVRRVEALFKVADQIEHRYEKATAYVEKLTQSILAKAFGGELVPTEAELARREGRDYEPASVLLERIKAEREALEKEERPKKRAVLRRRKHHRTAAKETATESKSAASADTSESPKRVSTASDSSLRRTAVPIVDDKGTRAKQEKTSLAAKKHKPTISQRPVALSDLDTDEVMAIFRKACRGHGAMTREELLKEVCIFFDYQRLSSAIQERLKGHLRAAIRRGIVEADGELVRPATRTVDDYSRDSLIETLHSVMRSSKLYDQEEVIRAAAEHLGFSKVNERIRGAFRSAIRKGVRTGKIISDRHTIWRL